MLTRYDAKVKGLAVNRNRPPPDRASRLSAYYPVMPVGMGEPSPLALPQAGAPIDSVVLKRLAPNAAGARRLAAQRR